MVQSFVLLEQNYRNVLVGLLINTDHFLIPLSHQNGLIILAYILAQIIREQIFHPNFHLEQHIVKLDFYGTIVTFLLQTNYG